MKALFWLFNHQFSQYKCFQAEFLVLFLIQNLFHLFLDKWVTMIYIFLKFHLNTAYFPPQLGRFDGTGEKQRHLEE